MQSQAQSVEVEKNNIGALRQYLQEGFLALKTSYAEKPSIAHLFRQHCKLIDQLLM